jgi:hypothetical protein
MTKLGNPASRTLRPPRPKAFARSLRNPCHRGGHLVRADASELAGSGQSNAAWSAVEEGDTEVLFEGVHVL